jgi:hypothetical protein
MPQQVRRRKQVNVNYESNSKVSERLSRGMVYRELYIRLKGAATTTAGNNTKANTARGDEWGVIKRIDIIANNTDVIRSISGNELWWLNYFFFGKIPFITAALGDGATANPPFDSTLILPFWMPRSLRPMDTALDARELSDLKIEITWGAYTDVNSAATAWTTEPVVEVHSLESFNVKGPFSQWRIYTIEKEITATNAQFQVQLPVGPMYRGFMFATTDAGVDDADIINNMKIKSGTTIYADIPQDILFQADAIRRGDPRSWDSTAEGYDSLRRGTPNGLGGWLFYDHVTDGYLTEAIDTLGFSEFELELDVTVGAGTTKLYVSPLQVIPVRGK